MSASQPATDQDMDSSATNLNSSSTQTTELQSESPSSSLPQKDAKSRISPPHLSPRLFAVAVSSSSNALLSSAPAPSSTASTAASSPLPDAGENHRTSSIAGPIDRDTAESKRVEDFKKPASLQSPGLLRTAEETADFVTPLQSFSNYSSLTSPLGTNARLAGFVSSEQLQEILQELNVDTIIETALKAPSQTARTPSQLKFTEASTLSPLSLRTPRSPHPPVVFRYPSISPYVMRKRRPPFHSPRRGLAPPCFYTGSEAVVCGRMRNKSKGKRPEGVTPDGTILQVLSSDLEVEEEEEDEEAEGQEVIRKCPRRVSRSHRCSVSPCAHHGHTPDVEAGGENEQHLQRLRDSCGYWDSDSSSSTDYCYYHRPYCDSCLQRGSLLSSDTSSDSSDSDYEGYSPYRSPHPVVFKDDIKPTFV